MAKKQEITIQEARILVFISQVKNPEKFPTTISKKLEISYTYTTRLLSLMFYKGWLTVHKLHQKRFYDIVPNRQEIHLARVLLTNTGNGEKE